MLNTQYAKLLIFFICHDMRTFFFNFSNAPLGKVKYNQYICALQNQNI